MTDKQFNQSKITHSISVLIVFMVMFDWLNANHIFQKKDMTIICLFHYYFPESSLRDTVLLKTTLDFEVSGSTEKNPIRSN